jgi:hypothetical protein
MDQATKFVSSYGKFIFGRENGPIGFLLSVMKEKDLLTPHMKRVYSTLVIPFETQIVTSMAIQLPAQSLGLVFDFVKRKQRTSSKWFNVLRKLMRHGTPQLEDALTCVMMVACSRTGAYKRDLDLLRERYDLLHFRRLSKIANGAKQSLLKRELLALVQAVDSERGLTFSSLDTNHELCHPGTPSFSF